MSGRQQAGVREYLRLQVNPHESDVDMLRQQLRLDNISKVEHSDEEIELAILLRAEKEELVAGISGTL